jgi:hypothetical protein
VRGIEIKLKKKSDEASHLPTISTGPGIPVGLLAFWPEKTLANCFW